MPYDLASLATLALVFRFIAPTLRIFTGLFFLLRFLLLLLLPLPLLLGFRLRTSLSDGSDSCCTPQNFRTPVLTPMQGRKFAVFP
jgi:hypothetical protein